MLRVGERRLLARRFPVVVTFALPDGSGLTGADDALRMQRTLIEQQEELADREREVARALIRAPTLTGVCQDAAEVPEAE